MSFCQTKLESELNEIVYQSLSTENAYIDSLFQFVRSKDSKIITNEIEEVYDRRELLLITTNYEKIAKVYENGNPIVKSIKNRATGITYWNLFHKNGNLRLTGYSFGYILHIGNWEEFDENGRLIQIINEESTRVSFNTIYKKLVDLDVIENDIDLNYSIEDNIWIIKDWSTEKKYTIDNCLNIQINRF